MEEVDGKEGECCWGIEAELGEDRESFDEKERCSEGGGGSWREGEQETEEERVWRGEDENEGKTLSPN